MFPIRPFLGSKPFAVLLCRFKDQPHEPKDRSFFESWIARGNQGVNDYFHDVSYGKCNLDGSRVFGWFELPYTEAENASISKGAHVEKAVNAVKDHVNIEGFFGVCVIVNASQFGHGTLGPLTIGGNTRRCGLVFLGPKAWQPSVACQEICHAFGLSNHSRNADRPDADYGNPFDIMSTLGPTTGQTCFMFPDSRYDVDGRNDNKCGPGMNTPNLDAFGWLNPDRIYQVPTYVFENSIFSKTKTIMEEFTIELSAVNHPENGQPLCVTVDANSNSFGSFTYYIEYRTADGWDRGIGEKTSAAVLIQQMRTDGHNYLVRAPTRYWFIQGETYSKNEITITVVEFNDNVCTLKVTRPVQHFQKSPVDGPNRPDWHIYEALHRRVNEAERSIESLRDDLKNLGVGRKHPIK